MAHYAATVKDDRTLELPQEARQYVQPGQVVQIELLDIPIPATKANHPILATLEKIAKRHEGRPHSDGSRTLEFLHEARDGAMYDYIPPKQLALPATVIDASFIVADATDAPGAQYHSL